MYNHGFDEILRVNNTILVYHNRRILFYVSIVDKECHGDRVDLASHDALTESWCSIGSRDPRASDKLHGGTGL